MDTASAARMSDPALNPHFRRRWQEPPDEPVTAVKPDRALTAMAQAFRDAWLRCELGPKPRDRGGA
ncbi:hypothetical protein [Dankookia sp. P2]|uniref:hypothetical protein n=1 Tax=Dankookia sp. P2 TaxID=3423955 RepID=UPI003D670A6B